MKIKESLPRIWMQLVCMIFFFHFTNAQTRIETGGQKMPDEWIDGSTGHKIIKLTRREGNNMSFYFHNNPFVGNKSDGYRMIFYGTDYLNTAENDSVKQE